MDGNASKQRVAYYYDSEVGNYYYGPGHPMKPHRIRMTHNLVLHYGLYREMEVFRPRKATDMDMEAFHSDDYIEFLKNVSPETKNEMLRDCKRFAVGDDCPVFHGLYDYCQLYTGGSVGGAVQLNYKTSDVVVNWSGGLHHAKKSEASGFCYVNDIVLAILELLKFHERVLYIDIDIHHGDGVEEAFYTTDRVMTCSFHKFGDFFPGTGDLHDMGTGPGKFYAINAPLKDGMDDEAYSSIFMPVMEKVMEVFRPEAIVFQAGADSLAGDRLGVFNLSIHGHAACLRFMQSFGVPMLVLGGGGYTIRNVARCWTFETGCLLGKDLDDKLPPNEYYEYFAPNFELHIDTSNIENKNSKEHLERIRKELMERLDRLPRIPSTGFQQAPAALKAQEVPEEDLDERGGGKLYRERTKAYDNDEGELEDDGRGFGRPAGRSHRELDFSKPGPSGQGKAEAEEQEAAEEAREISGDGEAAAEPMEVDNDTDPAVAADGNGSGPVGDSAAGEESRQGTSVEEAKTAQEEVVVIEEEEEEEVLVEEEVDEEEEEFLVEEREADEDAGTPGSSAGQPPAPFQAAGEPPAAST